MTSLVHGYLRAAYAVALAIVGRPADAEDIAQETFLKAFAHLETCRQPERFAAWLLQIARNQARNLYQRRRLCDVAGAGAKILEFSSKPPRSVGMRQALLDGLARLDERQREVVLLHDLECWTHSEIAALLDLTEVHSRQLLWQARQSLRQRLGEDRALEEDHGG